MGDIPNLEVGADGGRATEGRHDALHPVDGPLSLFDADGSAIIIHGNPDQMITGARSQA